MPLAISADVKFQDQDQDIYIYIYVYTRRAYWHTISGGYSIGACVGHKRVKIDKNGILKSLQGIKIHG